MPITDNSFTPEELGGALTANPALLDHVKTVLTGQKLQVLDDAGREALLKSHETKVVADKTREFATNLEKDVLEATGIQKEGDEKYYDYFKRATTTIKGSAAKLEKELTDLRSKGGNPNEADRARIAQLEKALQEKDKDFETKYNAAQQELLDTRATFGIESGINKLRGTYKPGIPESVIQVVEQNALRNLLKQAKFQDGENGAKVLTFVDEKGEVILNKTTYKPATAEELLRLDKTFQDLIDPGKKVEGTGTKGDQTGKGTPPGKFTEVPAEVKTRLQLTEHLLKLGIAADSEEFNKIMMEHGAKLPLR